MEFDRQGQVLEQAEKIDRMASRVSEALANRDAIAALKQEVAACVQSARPAVAAVPALTLAVDGLSAAAAKQIELAEQRLLAEEGVAELKAACENIGKGIADAADMMKTIREKLAGEPFAKDLLPALIDIDRLALEKEIKAAEEAADVKGVSSGQIAAETRPLIEKIQKIRDEVVLRKALIGLAKEAQDTAALTGDTAKCKAAIADLEQKLAPYAVDEPATKLIEAIRGLLATLSTESEVIGLRNELELLAQKVKDAESVNDIESAIAKRAEAEAALKALEAKLGQAAPDSKIQEPLSSCRRIIGWAGQVQEGLTLLREAEDTVGGISRATVQDRIAADKVRKDIADLVDIVKDLAPALHDRASGLSAQAETELKRVLNELDVAAAIDELDKTIAGMQVPEKPAQDVVDQNDTTIAVTRETIRSLSKDAPAAFKGRLTELAAELDRKDLGNGVAKCVLKVEEIEKLIGDAEKLDENRGAIEQVRSQLTRYEESAKDTVRDLRGKLDALSLKGELVGELSGLGKDLRQAADAMSAAMSVDDLIERIEAKRGILEIALNGLAGRQGEMDEAMRGSLQKCRDALAWQGGLLTQAKNLQSLSVRIGGKLAEAEAVDKLENDVAALEKSVGAMTPAVQVMTDTMETMAVQARAVIATARAEMKLEDDLQTLEGALAQMPMKIGSARATDVCTANDTELKEFRKRIEAVGIEGVSPEKRSEAERRTGDMQTTIARLDAANRLKRCALGVDQIRKDIAKNPEKLLSDETVAGALARITEEMASLKALPADSSAGDTAGTIELLAFVGKLAKLLAEVNEETAKVEGLLAGDIGKVTPDLCDELGRVKSAFAARFDDLKTALEIEQLPDTAIARMEEKIAALDKKLKEHLEELQRKLEAELTQNVIAPIDALEKGPALPAGDRAVRFSALEKYLADSEAVADALRDFRGRIADGRYDEIARRVNNQIERCKRLIAFYGEATVFFDRAAATLPAAAESNKRLEAIEADKGLLNQNDLLAAVAPVKVSAEISQSIASAVEKAGGALEDMRNTFKEDFAAPDELRAAAAAISARLIPLDEELRAERLKMRAQWDAFEKACAIAAYRIARTADAAGKEKLFAELERDYAARKTELERYYGREIQAIWGVSAAARAEMAGPADPLVDENFRTEFGGVLSDFEKDAIEVQQARERLDDLLFRFVKMEPREGAVLFGGAVSSAAIADSIERLNTVANARKTAAEKFAREADALIAGIDEDTEDKYLASSPRTLQDAVDQAKNLPARIARLKKDDLARKIADVRLWKAELEKIRATPFFKYMRERYLARLATLPTIGDLNDSESAEADKCITSDECIALAAEFVANLKDVKPEAYANNPALYDGAIREFFKALQWKLRDACRMEIAGVTDDPEAYARTLQEKVSAFFAKLGSAFNAYEGFASLQLGRMAEGQKAKAAAGKVTAFDRVYVTYLATARDYRLLALEMDAVLVEYYGYSQKVMQNPGAFTESAMRNGLDAIFSKMQALLAREEQIRKNYEAVKAQDDPSLREPKRIMAGTLEKAIRSWSEQIRLLIAERAQEEDIATKYIGGIAGRAGMVLDVQKEKENIAREPITGEAPTVAEMRTRTMGDRAELLQISTSLDPGKVQEAFDGQKTIDGQNRVLDNATGHAADAQIAIAEKQSRNPVLNGRGAKLEGIAAADPSNKAAQEAVEAYRSLKQGLDKAITDLDAKSKSVQDKIAELEASMAGQVRVAMKLPHLEQWKAKRQLEELQKFKEMALRILIDLKKISVELEAAEGNVAAFRNASEAKTDAEVEEFVKRIERFVADTREALIDTMGQEDVKALRRSTLPEVAGERVKVDTQEADIGRRIDVLSAGIEEIRAKIGEIAEVKLMQGLTGIDWISLGRTWRHLTMNVPEGPALKKDVFTVLPRILQGISKKISATMGDKAPEYLRLLAEKEARMYETLAQFADLLVRVRTLPDGEQLYEAEIQKFKILKGEFSKTLDEVISDYAKLRTGYEKTEVRELDEDLAGECGLKVNDVIMSMFDPSKDRKKADDILEDMLQVIAGVAHKSKLAEEILNPGAVGDSIRVLRNVREGAATSAGLRGIFERIADVEKTLTGKRLYAEEDFKALGDLVKTVAPEIMKILPNVSEDQKTELQERFAALFAVYRTGALEASYADTVRESEGAFNRLDPAKLGETGADPELTKNITMLFNALASCIDFLRAEKDGLADILPEKESQDIISGMKEFFKAKTSQILAGDLGASFLNGIKGVSPALADPALVRELENGSYPLVTKRWFTVLGRLPYGYNTAGERKTFYAALMEIANVTALKFDALTAPGGQLKIDPVRRQFAFADGWSGQPLDREEKIAATLNAALKKALEAYPTVDTRKLTVSFSSAMSKPGLTRLGGLHGGGDALTVVLPWEIAGALDQRPWLTDYMAYIMEHEMALHPSMAVEGDPLQEEINVSVRGLNDFVFTKTAAEQINVLKSFLVLEHRQRVGKGEIFGPSVDLSALPGVPVALLVHFSALGLTSEGKKAQKTFMTFLRRLRDKTSDLNARVDLEALLRALDQVIPSAPERFVDYAEWMRDVVLNKELYTLVGDATEQAYVQGIEALEGMAPADRDEAKYKMAEAALRDPFIMKSEAILGLTAGIEAAGTIDELSTQLSYFDINKMASAPIEPEFVNAVRRAAVRKAEAMVEAMMPSFSPTSEPGAMADRLAKIQRSVSLLSDRIGFAEPADGERLAKRILQIDTIIGASRKQYPLKRIDDFIRDVRQAVPPMREKPEEKLAVPSAIAMNALFARQYAQERLAALNAFIAETGVDFDQKELEKFRSALKGAVDEALVADNKIGKMLSFDTRKKQVAARLQGVKTAADADEIVREWRALIAENERSNGFCYREQLDREMQSVKDAEAAAKARLAPRKAPPAAPVTPALEFRAEIRSLIDGLKADPAKYKTLQKDIDAVLQKYLDMKVDRGVLGASLVELLNAHIAAYLFNPAGITQHRDVLTALAERLAAEKYISSTSRIRDFVELVLMAETMLKEAPLIYAMEIESNKAQLPGAERNKLKLDTVARRLTLDDDSRAFGGALLLSKLFDGVDVEAYIGEKLNEYRKTGAQETLNALTLIALAYPETYVSVFESPANNALLKTVPAYLSGETRPPEKADASVIGLYFVCGDFLGNRPGGIASNLQKLSQLMTVAKKEKIGAAEYTEALQKLGYSADEIKTSLDQRKELVDAKEKFDAARARLKESRAEVVSRLSKQVLPEVTALIESWKAQLAVDDAVMVLVGAFVSGELDEKDFVANAKDLNVAPDKIAELTGAVAATRAILASEVPKMLKGVERKSNLMRDEEYLALARRLARVWLPSFARELDNREIAAVAVGFLRGAVSDTALQAAVGAWMVPKEAEKFVGWLKASRDSLSKAVGQLNAAVAKEADAINKADAGFAQASEAYWTTWTQCAIDQKTIDSLKRFAGLHPFLFYRAANGPGMEYWKKSFAAILSSKLFSDDMSLTPGERLDVQNILVGDQEVFDAFRQAENKVRTYGERAPPALVAAVEAFNDGAQQYMSLSVDPAMDPQVHADYFRDLAARCMIHANAIGAAVMMNDLGRLPESIRSEIQALKDLNPDEGLASLIVALVQKYGAPDRLRLDALARAFSILDVGRLPPILPKKLDAYADRYVNSMRDTVEGGVASQITRLKTVLTEGGVDLTAEGNEFHGLPPNIAVTLMPINAAAVKHIFDKTYLYIPSIAEKLVSDIMNDPDRNEKAVCALDGNNVVLFAADGTIAILTDEEAEVLRGLGMPFYKAFVRGGEAGIAGIEETAEGESIVVSPTGKGSFSRLLFGAVAGMEKTTEKKIAEDIAGLINKQAVPEAKEMISKAAADRFEALEDLYQQYRDYAFRLEFLKWGWLYLIAPTAVVVFAGYMLPYWGVILAGYLVQAVPILIMTIRYRFFTLADDISGDAAKLAEAIDVFVQKNYKDSAERAKVTGDMQLLAQRNVKEFASKLETILAGEMLTLCQGAVDTGLLTDKEAGQEMIRRIAKELSDEQARMTMNVRRLLLGSFMAVWPLMGWAIALVSNSGDPYDIASALAPQIQKKGIGQAARDLIQPQKLPPIVAEKPSTAMPSVASLPAETPPPIDMTKLQLPELATVPAKLPEAQKGMEPLFSQEGPKGEAIVAPIVPATGTPRALPPVSMTPATDTTRVPAAAPATGTAKVEAAAVPASATVVLKPAIGEPVISVRVPEPLLKELTDQLKRIADARVGELGAAIEQQDSAAKAARARYDSAFKGFTSVAGTYDAALADKRAADAALKDSQARLAKIADELKTMRAKLPSPAAARQAQVSAEMDRLQKEVNALEAAFEAERQKVDILKLTVGEKEELLRKQGEAIKGVTDRLYQAVGLMLETAAQKEKAPAKAPYAGLTLDSFIRGTDAQGKAIVRRLDGGAESPVGVLQAPGSRIQDINLEIQRLEEKLAEAGFKPTADFTIGVSTAGVLTPTLNIVFTQDPAKEAVKDKAELARLAQEYVTLSYRKALALKAVFAYFDYQRSRKDEAYLMAQFLRNKRIYEREIENFRQGKIPEKAMTEGRIDLGKAMTDLTQATFNSFRALESLKIAAGFDPQIPVSIKGADIPMNDLREVVSYTAELREKGAVTIGGTTYAAKDFAGDDGQVKFFEALLANKIIETDTLGLLGIAADPELARTLKWTYLDATISAAKEKKFTSPADEVRDAFAAYGLDKISGRPEEILAALGIRQMLNEKTYVERSNEPKYYLTLGISARGGVGLLLTKVRMRENIDSRVPALWIRMSEDKVRQLDSDLTAEVNTLITFRSSQRSLIEGMQKAIAAVDEEISSVEKQYAKDYAAASALRSLYLKKRLLETRLNNAKTERDVVDQKILDLGVGDGPDMPLRMFIRSLIDGGQLAKAMITAGALPEKAGEPGKIDWRKVFERPDAVAAVTDALAKVGAGTKDDKGRMRYEYRSLAGGDEGITYAHMALKLLQEKVKGAEGYALPKGAIGQVLGSLADNVRRSGEFQAASHELDIARVDLENAIKRGHGRAAPYERAHREEEVNRASAAMDTVLNERISGFLGAYGDLIVARSRIRTTALNIAAAERERAVIAERIRDLKAIKELSTDDQLRLAELEGWRFEKETEAAELNANAAEEARNLAVAEQHYVNALRYPGSVKITYLSDVRPDLAVSPEAAERYLSENPGRAGEVVVNDFAFSPQAMDTLVSAVLALYKEGADVELINRRLQALQQVFLVSIAGHVDFEGDTGKGLRYIASPPGFQRIPRIDSTSLNVPLQAEPTMLAASVLSSLLSHRYMTPVRRMDIVNQMLDLYIGSEEARKFISELAGRQGLMSDRYREAQAAYQDALVQLSASEKELEMARKEAAEGIRTLNAEKRVMNAEKDVSRSQNAVEMASVRLAMAKFNFLATRDVAYTQFKADFLDNGLLQEVIAAGDVIRSALDKELAASADKKGRALTLGERKRVEDAVMGRYDTLLKKARTVLRDKLAAMEKLPPAPEFLPAAGPTGRIEQIKGLFVKDIGEFNRLVKEKYMTPFMFFTGREVTSVRRAASVGAARPDAVMGEGERKLPAERLEEAKRQEVGFTVGLYVDLQKARWLDKEAAKQAGTVYQTMEAFRQEQISYNVEFLKRWVDYNTATEIETFFEDGMDMLLADLSRTAFKGEAAELKEAFAETKGLVGATKEQKILELLDRIKALEEKFKIEKNDTGSRMLTAISRLSGKLNAAAVARNNARRQLFRDTGFAAVYKDRIEPLNVNDLDDAALAELLTAVSIQHPAIRQAVYDADKAQLEVSQAQREKNLLLPKSFTVTMGDMLSDKPELALAATFNIADNGVRKYRAKKAQLESDRAQLALRSGKDALIARFLDAFAELEKLRDSIETRRDIVRNAYRLYQESRLNLLPQGQVTVHDLAGKNADLIEAGAALLADLAASEKLNGELDEYYRALTGKVPDARMVAGDDFKLRLGRLGAAQEVVKKLEKIRDGMMQGYAEWKEIYDAERLISEEGPLAWPLEKAGVVTSAYGEREKPTIYGSTEHNGVDLRADEGDKVSSAMEGTVVYAGDSSMGGAVVIQNDLGLETRYLHLDPTSISVKPGMRVKAGTFVGKVGPQLFDAKGQAITTAPHLHYEVRLHVDPKGYGLPRPHDSADTFDFDRGTPVNPMTVAGVFHQQKLRGADGAVQALRAKLAGLKNDYANAALIPIRQKEIARSIERIQLQLSSAEADLQAAMEKNEEAAARISALEDKLNRARKAQGSLEEILAKMSDPKAFEKEDPTIVLDSLIALSRDLGISPEMTKVLEKLPQRLQGATAGFDDSAARAYRQGLLAALEKFFESVQQPRATVALPASAEPFAKRYGAAFDAFLRQLGNMFNEISDNHPVYRGRLDAAAKEIAIYRDFSNKISLLAARKDKAAAEAVAVVKQEMEKTIAELDKAQREENMLQADATWKRVAEHMQRLVAKLFGAVQDRGVIDPPIVHEEMKEHLAALQTYFMEKYPADWKARLDSHVREMRGLTGKLLAKVHITLGPKKILNEDDLLVVLEKYRQLSKLEPEEFVRTMTDALGLADRVYRSVNQNLNVVLTPKTGRIVLNGAPFGVSFAQGTYTLTVLDPKTGAATAEKYEIKDAGKQKKIRGVSYKVLQSPGFADGVVVLEAFNHALPTMTGRHIDPLFALSQKVQFLHEKLGDLNIDTRKIGLLLYYARRLAYLQNNPGQLEYGTPEKQIDAEIAEDGRYFDYFFNRTVQNFDPSEYKGIDPVKYYEWQKKFEKRFYEAGFDRAHYPALDIEQRSIEMRDYAEKLYDQNIYLNGFLKHKGIRYALVIQSLTDPNFYDQMKVISFVDRLMHQESHAIDLAKQDKVDLFASNRPLTYALSVDRSDPSRPVLKISQKETGEEATITPGPGTVKLQGATVTYLWDAAKNRLELKMGFYPPLTDEKKIVRYDESGQLQYYKSVNDPRFADAMREKVGSIVFGREFFWANYVIELHRGKIPATDRINEWTRVMLAEKEYYVSFDPATKIYTLKTTTFDMASGRPAEKRVTFGAADTSVAIDGVSYKIDKKPLTEPGTYEVMLSADIGDPQTVRALQAYIDRYFEDMKDTKQIVEQFYRKAYGDAAWQIDLDDPAHLERVGKWSYWTQFMRRYTLTPAMLELLFNNMLSMLEYKTEIPPILKQLGLEVGERIDMDNPEQAGFVSYFGMDRIINYDLFDGAGKPLPSDAPQRQGWDADALMKQQLSRLLFLMSPEVRPLLEKYRRMLGIEPVTLDPRDKASAGAYGFLTKDTLRLGETDAQIKSGLEDKINILEAAKRYWNWFRVDSGGRTAFVVRQDDGSYRWIDGDAVIRFVPEKGQTVTAAVTMGGKQLAITAQCDQDGVVTSISTSDPAASVRRDEIGLSEEDMQGWFNFQKDKGWDRNRMAGLFKMIAHANRSREIAVRSLADELEKQPLEEWET
ncbi:MAG TPA: peptidoglycan DD-metalloendopeptidase family protein, partial [bacterium]|nr:peptidoglycan DD-metalloendopeptidase family protein [bacterium]